MEQASIKVRFLTSMVANIFRVIISFSTGLIIARVLGPAEYGNFSFLLGSFTALSLLVGMASSSAFYTFISQKKRGTTFFIYYSVWLLMQFILLLLLVIFLPTSLKEKVWLGHSGDLILLALFTSFAMNQIWRFAGQIGESIRDTVGVQIRNVVRAVTYLTCVLLLTGFRLLSVKVLFIINAIVYFSLATLYAWRLYQMGTFSQAKSENLKNILGEFKTFCLPLILLAFAGFFHSFADYWLLQKFGGSVQQGYYAIGARFAALSLIATTSMVLVFWKEISEAHALGNMKRVRDLYKRISQGLYFFGAFCSCLLIPFSREILGLLLGPAYQDAWLPLSLMFLYPIHQSMGQITGTMLFATGKTKVKANIGVFFVAISIPTTYFMLAPKNLFVPGLNMGATGLALKMLFCQIIEVNLMAFFIARYLKISFDWGHQIIVLLFLIPFGFLSKLLSQWVLSLILVSPHSILVMASTGICYLGAVIVLVYFLPSITGINIKQISQGFSWLRARINPA